MSPQVVGFGPRSDVFPYIPQFIIIESYNSKLRLNEAGEVSPIEFDGNPEPLLYPVDLRHDNWCAVEEDKTLTWFSRDDKKRWIDTRANSLVRNAKMDPNPIRALSMLRAAAKMCGFELYEFLEALEVHRQKPDESLEDIFKRLNVKNSR